MGPAVDRASLWAGLAATLTRPKGILGGTAVIAANRRCDHSRPATNAEQADGFPVGGEPAPVRHTAHCRLGHGPSHGRAGRR